MMTQPLPIAGKLPIKLWLLSNYQQMYMHVCTQANGSVHVAMYTTFKCMQVYRASHSRYLCLRLEII